MVRGDVPYYVKIWPKLTIAFKNADFRSIFARIALQPCNSLDLAKQVGLAQLSQRDRAAGWVNYGQSGRLQLHGR